MEKVLFRGTKTFWKTKNSVEVAVIDHRDFDVLEVVTFEPVLQVEAPRLYVDAQVLRHILTVDDQNGEIKKGQSSIIASGPDPMGKFVFNHLFITTFLPSSKKFVVEVRRGYRPAAEHEDEEDLIVARPAHLIPCQAPFESALMENVAKLVSPRSAALRDMWRIPLILVRLSKSLPLSETDNAIWARFMEGKSPEQLIGSMAKALSARVAEDSNILHRVAHSIILPQQTPFPAPRLRMLNPQDLPSADVEDMMLNSGGSGAYPTSATPCDGSGLLTPSRTGMPPLQPGSSTSSRGRSSVRNVFKRDGTLSTTSSGRCSPASGAISMRSSPASSRDSSPARGGMLGVLLRRSPSPSARYGDHLLDGMRRPSFGESIVHAVQRGLGKSRSAPPSPRQDDTACDDVPLFKAHSAVTKTMDMEEDEAMLTFSIAPLKKQSIDGLQAPTTRSTATGRRSANRQEPGAKPESPRMAALRQRRRTFNDQSEDNCVRIYLGHHRVGSDGQALPTNAPTAATGAHHVRSGSGGMAGIASLLGLSGGHRVVPVSTQGAMMAAWEDNEAVFGNPK